MRFVQALARILGWLLTPLLAWAASFIGAFVGALVARTMSNSTAGLVVTGLFAALFAISATIGWMRMLRRSPELRHALHVTAEGLPTVSDQDEAERATRLEAKREAKLKEGE